MSRKRFPGFRLRSRRAVNGFFRRVKLAPCAVLLALLAVLAAPRARAGAADVDLRQAAAEGDAARTAALLQAGADPNSVDEDGVTPLMIAVVGDPERIRGLIRKGIGGDWRKGVRKAVKFIDGDPATARELLNGGAEVDRATPRGITALSLAALGGEVEMVRLLLEAGAEVDATAKRGETALMVAALAGHTEVVELLLAAGAEPTLQTGDGVTAALAALLGGHPETAQAIGKAIKARPGTPPKETQ